MTARESPRIRRLRNDLRALETLRAESSIVDFVAPSNLYGGLPESYLIRFYGKGLWRPEGSQDVLLRDRHEVAVTLGASYPRMQPELQWKTPIFHPNISAGGVVCLGGYQTHWVPSVNLDELCTMLWDMIRYANYDVESPYNREAAQWARTQSQFALPLDDRPIRDRVATGQRPAATTQPSPQPLKEPEPEVVFLDSSETNQADPTNGEEIVEAEIVEAEIVEAEAGSPFASPSPASPSAASPSAASPSADPASDPEDPDIMFIE